MHRAALTLCLAFLASPIHAQDAPFWPGARYDPAIPTVRQVLGHEPGAEITPPEQVGPVSPGAPEGRADAHAAWSSTRGAGKAARCG